MGNGFWILKICKAEKIVGLRLQDIFLINNAFGTSYELVCVYYVP